ncbi:MULTISPECIES: cytochrome c oxidase subunit CcoM [Pseudomonas]|nr:MULTISPECIES: cytochrome c oxidase subunit CcoM [Pseudomonas]
MFIDEAVIAGILTVGLMVVFLGGVGLFIWRDSRKPARAIKRP